MNPGFGNSERPDGGNSAGPMSHDAMRSIVDTQDRTADKGVPKKAPKTLAVSKKTRRLVSTGVAFAGICAAAMSAPTLYSLARLGHVPPALAWLLPACLDGYAFTSIQFGHAVPTGHPARTAAKRNARVALLLTVMGNAVYHVLVLAGSMLPSRAPVVLLVVILSLPPFIVDRLMHLHSMASGTEAVEAASASTASEPKASTAAVEPREWKPAVKAPGFTPLSSTPAPASTAHPSTTSTESPAASTPARPASVANVRSETRRVASGPIPIQPLDRVKIVRDWIKEAGGDYTAVPLKRIEERFGVSQPTASRIRAAASTPADKPHPAPESADEEPQQVLEAIS